MKTFPLAILSFVVPTAAFVPSKPISDVPLTVHYSAAATAAAVEPAKKLLVAAGAAVGTALGSFILRNQGTKACLDKIDDAFPGSLANKELVDRVVNKLSDYGIDDKKTLLCTSLCGDEIARGLENDFASVYGNVFHRMGGLAGFPFGGISAFCSMTSHIPDDGFALIVFGPHVGVDAAGHTGTVARRGCNSSAACCEAAMAASKHVTSVWAKQEEAFDMPLSPKDAQYVYLCNALMPYAERIDQSKDPMVELPYAMYDAQKEMIVKIIEAGCASIPEKSRVAVLGGIQINTPPGTTDYFIPLSFDLFNNKGEDLEDFTL